MDENNQSAKLMAKLTEAYQMAAERGLLPSVQITDDGFGMTREFIRHVVFYVLRVQPEVMNEFKERLEKAKLESAEAFSQASYDYFEALSDKVMHVALDDEIDTIKRFMEEDKAKREEEEHG